MFDNKRIINNFIWRFLERIGAQGISFIISIVLARILEPNVYGTVALVTAIMAMLNVLVDSGFGTALIQKKNADNLDFSSVFWFNIVVCVFLYALMFFFSGLISNFYGIPELGGIIKVLSLGILISGVKNVQQAYVSRNLIFKKFFFATIGGTLVSGVAGVFLALRGTGVWALVAQNLTNQIVDTLILWITVKWRPQLCFSFQRFKGLFSYGWKLLATALIDTFYNQARQLIIGKKYTSNALAYYNQGYKLPSLVVVNIDTSIDSVLLPALSEEQADKQRVRAMTRSAISISTYLIMPMLAGLAACATPLVIIVLTEKWLPCVPFLRVFCLSYAFYPIHTANLNAIKAMGRSDILLKLEIVKKVIGFLSILIAMNYGAMAMAYSLLITSVISQIINSWPNKSLLDYSYLDQLKDIFPQTALTAAMLGIVLLFENLKMNNWIILIIQITVGIFVYIVGSGIFRIESYSYLKTVIKNYIHK